MRTASGLAATLVLLISSTRGSWAQAPDPIGPPTPRPLASGSVVATILTLGLVAVIVFAVVAVARFVAARRKRMTEAMIFQSQLSDAVAREPLMQGLRINPRARVSGWRRSHVTIEVAGEVPTPALREKAMRIVEAEAWRLRPDIKTVDHLFIVPPPQRVSESFVPRG